MRTHNPKSYDPLRCCILFFISILPPIKRLTSASLCLNATTKDDSSSTLDLLLRRLYASSTLSFKTFWDSRLQYYGHITKPAVQRSLPSSSRKGYSLYLLKMHWGEPQAFHQIGFSLFIIMTVHSPIQPSKHACVLWEHFCFPLRMTYDYLKVECVVGQKSILRQR